MADEAADLAGVIADALGMSAAIWTVAALTGASGLVTLTRMYETQPGPAQTCTMTEDAEVAPTTSSCGTRLRRW